MIHRTEPSFRPTYYGAIARRAERLSVSTGPTGFVLGFMAAALIFSLALAGMKRPRQIYIDELRFGSDPAPSAPARAPGELFNQEA